MNDTSKTCHTLALSHFFFSVPVKVKINSTLLENRSSIPMIRVSWIQILICIEKICWLTEMNRREQLRTLILHSLSQCLAAQEVPSPSCEELPCSEGVTGRACAWLIILSAFSCKVTQIGSLGCTVQALRDLNNKHTLTPAGSTFETVKLE